MSPPPSRISSISASLARAQGRGRRPAYQVALRSLVPVVCRAAGRISAALGYREI
ncbi:MULTISPECIES: hypothetical protein [unclassified Rhodococcus (in: high G+C Gram-positive bacteria)]|uniref:hypothetical protein n=1 Tax=unclassified Rhodococcus (in: high G+C Gram-positive bacteria) TaxID=192944 RepID=UPI00163A4B98|nr:MULTISPECIES: hypothetical protein [unclassified Rhodococcus (in: high G+C Gram-positive bacteria)]MBC2638890.1 hypothetical protein [Rhodococcus sp. 3A]MBC2896369.1 hypothetical protein [Rhodococcus sp. 4CII]